MVDCYIGTSGFSYKEWQGHFYPEKIAPAEMLPYYGERLNSVEINNTFYRMPRRNVLEGWADATPGSFRFAIKASRRITHFKHLKDADEPMEYLLTNLAVLGERLGCVLFQLPPALRRNTEALGAFLELVPVDLRVAFEFRNDSWFEDEVMDLLREHNAAVCHADGEDEALPLVSTADWGYLRMRRPVYTDDELASWRERITAFGWHRAFVYFKHEDEGAGPKMALRFGNLMEA